MITIYTKNNCPQCMVTKLHLVNMFIPYDERNVDTNERYMEQAMKHILKVEKLREQHAELEDLEAALIEPFADSSFPWGSDIEIGIWDAKGIKYRVCLEQDLGITSLTSDFREILTAELEERKEVLEIELNKLIGGKTE